MTVKTQKTLGVVSNGVTPYGTHFLRRVADELTDFTLRTIYPYEFIMGQWQILLPSSINAINLGKGEKSPGLYGLAGIRNGWTRYRQVVQEIQAVSPAAVLILGYGSLAHILIIEWCYRNGIPCLMWADSNILGNKQNGAKAWLKKMVVTRVVSRCNAILPCGTLGAQYYQKYGAHPEQIFSVPCEPDYSLIENVPPNVTESLAAEYRLDPGRHRLLYSGRLVAIKRVDLLIDAFTRIADQRPEWDLLIAGGGPLETELKARVPERLRQRVLWTGFIDSPQRMSALYQFADVLVLPSDNEPWALVVNEAACAGLALVCSDFVGAAAELLVDGKNGRFFRPGNIPSLEMAIKDVTDDGNIRRYRISSREILKNWRRKTDPVEGLRLALNFCLAKG